MIAFERRERVTGRRRVSVAVGSLVVALLIVAVVLAIAGSNPFTTYREMLHAAFTNPGALTATLIDATPLVLTGLCAAVAFRLEVYNIGGEGQLYMGAVAATAAGLACGSAPSFVVILVMALAGAVAGAVWALIPALLRAYLHTNEILTSLMLNYVAGLFISYLIFDSTSYWRNLTSSAGKVYPTGKTVPASGWWPSLHLGGVSVPLGFLVGIVLAAILAAALRRTTVGFRVKVTAGSPVAARYSGISLSKMVLLVMTVSGVLAGLAGASEVGGFSHLLDPAGLQQAQFGYAGIVVAALASFEPLAVILTGLLLGAITSAGTQLAGIAFPQGLVGTIEGVVLFTVVSAAILVQYRFRWGFRRPASVLPVAGDQQAAAGDTSGAGPVPGAVVAATSPGMEV